MSLFGSLYDEEAENGASAPAPPEAGPDAALPDVEMPDVEMPDVEMPEDDSARDEDAPAPVAELDIDAPSMSLQDFAAEMFDGRTSPDGSDDEPEAPASIDAPDDHHDDSPDDSPDESPGESPGGPDDHQPDGPPAPAEDLGSGAPDPGFSSLFASGDDTGDEPGGGHAPGIPDAGAEPTTTKPTGSLASAASEIADLAKAPVATLASPDGADEQLDDDGAWSEPLDEPGTSATSEPPDTSATFATSATSEGTIDFGEPLVVDDLLPSTKPGGGTSLPSLSEGIPVKLIAVLLVAAVAGFLGMRMLGGNAGDEPSADGSSPGAGAAGDAETALPDTPSSPAELLDRAQAAGGEAELRNATLAAQAEYANRGTFARPASDWAALLPQGEIRDGADADPARDVISVVSDDDAACFETLLQDGTTVAAAVTATTVGMNQEPGGGSICTTDAAAVESWATSLSDL